MALEGQKADVYPEETNKALSVSGEVSQPGVASLERCRALIVSLRGDDHTASRDHQENTQRKHAGDTVCSRNPQLQRKCQVYSKQEKKAFILSSTYC